MAQEKPKKAAMENVNAAGCTTQVDADKYEAMKRAFLNVLPAKSPGSTAAEIGERVAPPPGGGLVSARRQGRLVEVGGAAPSGGEKHHQARGDQATALAHAVSAGLAAPVLTVVPDSALRPSGRIKRPATSAAR